MVMVTFRRVVHYKCDIFITFFWFLKSTNMLYPLFCFISIIITRFNQSIYPAFFQRLEKHHKVSSMLPNQIHFKRFSLIKKVHSVFLVPRSNEPILTLLVSVLHKIGHRDLFDKRQFCARFYLQIIKHLLWWKHLGSIFYFSVQTSEEQVREFLWWN